MKPTGTATQFRFFSLLQWLWRRVWPKNYNYVGMWENEETKMILTIWTDSEQLTGAVRDIHVFKKIAKVLGEHGFH